MEDSALKTLAEINDRLGQLVALTAANSVAGLNQKKAIEKLGALGFDANSIATMTGYPKTSVAHTLSNLKKLRGKGN